MKVYVVCRVGPEWQNLIEGYFDKHQAESAANALEKERLKKAHDVFESLSTYVVVALVMKDKR
jgi:hypothetical protein